MAEKRYSKAVAVITVLWLITSAAVLTLATADPNVAQAGCGGGSASPSRSASPSSSSSGGGTGLPTNATTILPIPGGSSSGSASPSSSASRSASASGSAANDQIVPVAQEQTCKSTITIAYESGKAPRFTGKVGSDEPQCRRARNVTVKKVKRGKDATVGKATTNAKGKYTVPVRNEAKGRFYAKVAKANVENDGGSTISCGAARSRTIRP